MRPCHARTGLTTKWLLMAGLCAIAACNPTTFQNNTASLGGDTPGARANIDVSFVNHTPFRAIFTYGTYDPQNDLFLPVFAQFTAAADPTFRLEGNSEAGPFTFPCGRAFSVGGNELIHIMAEKGLDRGLDEAALVPGITFSDKPLDDPEAEAPTAGRTEGVVTIQGAEYPCGSNPNTLIVYTFDLDSTTSSGFKITTQVFPG